MVIIAIAVGHRVLLEVEGRAFKTLSLSESDRLIRPLEIGDLQDRGDLTVLKGSEVYDVLRAQYLVTPLKATQKIKIKSDRTYLITNRRPVFQLLQNRYDDLKPYRSQGIEFDGIQHPNALILVSHRKPSELESRSLGLFEDIQSANKNEYLFLVGVDVSRVLQSIEPAELEANVILSSNEVLHEKSVSRKLLGGSGSIYVLGKNAIRAEGRTEIVQDHLYLYEGAKPDGLNDGPIEAFGPTFFAYSLSLLVALIGLLGLALQGYPLRWAVYLVVGISGFVVLDSWHPFMTGLGVAGIFMLGLRTRSFTAGWFLLAGLVVYGFGFYPYRFNPTLNDLPFWIGASTGYGLIVTGWSDWLDRRVTFSDIIILTSGVLASGISLLNFDFLADNSTWTLMMYTLILPLGAFFASNRREHYDWLYSFGLVAWVIKLMQGFTVASFFMFITVIFVWALYQSIARWSYPGRRVIGQ